REDVVSLGATSQGRAYPLAIPHRLPSLPARLVDGGGGFQQECAGLAARVDLGHEAQRRRLVQHALVLELGTLAQLLDQVRHSSSPVPARRGLRRGSWCWRTIHPVGPPALEFRASPHTPP